MEYEKMTLVFIITAAFDLILNLAPPPVGATIIRDYFSKHTPLSAALVAGFIGALTYVVLNNMKNVQTIEYASFGGIVFVFLVSALIGYPMIWSGLFPHLNEFYYDRIPRYQSFLADGLSGVMVATVYWLLLSRANVSLIYFWVPALLVFGAFYDSFYPNDYRKAS